MTIDELKQRVNQLFAQARNPKLIDAERKTFLAQAMAYYNELKFADNGNVTIDEQRVNNAQQRFQNGAALRMAELNGDLKNLAAYTPEALEEHMQKTDADAEKYLSGNANDAQRANNILQQISSTWRVKGNSKEFNAVKRAMQAVANAENPSQADNYIATEALKTYIAKNLNKAKSAVGMTRMANALAFLKQTMPPADFQGYCNNLNLLRGIKHTTENQKFLFDKTDPRCIDPEMIGTVNDVYDTVRERFHQYALDEEKKIDPRDLATLTALKTLQAKNASRGENLIVEHEALEAEIEKIMKDRRFQDALKKYDRDELIEMAWWGNLKTIEDYTKGLTAEQMQRVDKTRQDRIDAENKRRDEILKHKAAQEKQMKEALENEEKRLQKEKEEKIREERRKIEEEKRKKEEEELRKIQKPITDLYKELAPEIKEMADPLNSAYSLIEDDHEEKCTTLAAKLVALDEIKRKHSENIPGEKIKECPTVNLMQYKQRVDELKKDPFIQKRGKDLKEHPDTHKYIKEYMDKASKNETLKKAEFGKEILAVAQLSSVLNHEYIEHYGLNKKEEKKYTLEEGYDFLQKKADEVITGKKNYKEIGKTVAMALTIRDLSQKEGGFDKNDVNNHFQKYLKDPLMEKVGQTMTSLTMQETLRALEGKPDRAKKFLELSDELYKNAALENEKRKAKKVSKNPLG